MAKFTDTRLNALANNTKSSSNKSSGDFATDSKNNKQSQSDSTSKKSSGTFTNAKSNLNSSSSSKSSGSSGSSKSSGSFSSKDAADKQTSIKDVIANLLLPQKAYAETLTDDSSSENKSSNSQNNSSFDPTYGLNQIFGSTGQSGVDPGSKKLSESEWIDNSNKASSFTDSLLSANRDEDGNYNPISILNGLVSNSGVGYTATDPNLASFYDGSELTNYQKDRINEINNTENTEDSSEEVYNPIEEMSFKDAVEAAMREYTGDDSWDFYSDYGKLAMDGSQDDWRNLVQSKYLQQAYIDQYGLDTDGDGKISDEEANSWYDQMKRENVSDLDFTNDDDITKRIFGNTGEGANNDIVDAINTLLVMNGDVDYYDEDTGNDLYSILGYSRDDSGNLVDSSGESAGLSTDDIARLSNSYKLAKLSDATDSGKSNVINMGSSSDDVSNYITSLLDNVYGGSSGSASLKNNSAATSDDNYNYTKNDNSYSGSGLDYMNDIVNSKDTAASAMLSYLMNNLQGYNDSGSKSNLYDSGFSLYNKSNK
jgi:hypothetical protein